MSEARFIDGFLPEPAANAMRLSGLAAEYPAGGVEDAGATYPGMSLTMGTPHEAAMARHMSRILERPVSIQASFFRLMDKDKATTHGHDFRVHYDSEYSDNAFLIHLSRPEDAHGGTAFWRHVGLNEVEMTPENAGVVNSDLCERSAWDMDSFVGVRWNRALVYPSNKIHSMWPLQGWGDTPKTSRLIWTALFS